MTDVFACGRGEIAVLRGFLWQRDAPRDPTML